MVRITALMDNRTSDPQRFIAEHGLSFYIEYGDKTILFDCGKTGAFLDNAKNMGIDLTGLDAVALSHGHYDHAGGYRHLIEAGTRCKDVYVGADFFETKYAREPEGIRNLAPDWDAPFVQNRGIACHRVEGILEVFPGAYLITGFPRCHGFETIPERFVRKKGDAWIGDDFHDEICLALQTEKGIALVVGCSHPGILNMVGHVRTAMGQPVWAVFGGTHLVEADGTRIQVTVKGLKDMGLELLGLCHCTGEGAVSAIAAMPDVKSCYLAAGDSITLEEREEYHHVTESGCQ